MLKRRAQEQQVLVAAGGGNGSGGRGHWQGCVPYICVIMCLTQESVQCLFLTSANSQLRLQLDACNCQNRWVQRDKTAVYFFLALSSADPQLFLKFFQSYGIACHSTLLLRLPNTVWISKWQLIVHMSSLFIWGRCWASSSNTSEDKRLFNFNEVGLAPRHNSMGAEWTRWGQLWTRGGRG